MAQIYRKWSDIYDASTNQRIPNVETLQRDYKGATEINPPWTPQTNANSTQPIIRPWSIGMSDWKSYQGLRDSVAEIIKIRQQGNKDIIDPTAYWKQKQATASEMDPILREMSPADQASIRLNREATASTALKSLGEERDYRERLAWTALQNMDSMYSNKVTEDKYAADRDLSERKFGMDSQMDKIRANQDAFNLWAELPFPNIWVTSSSSWNTSNVSNAWKTWGSLSWRNNNPWNLKFSNWQSEYWASKDANSAFASFPTEQDAYNAYKALLTSPTGIYRWLTNNEAMLKWSSDYAWDPRAYNYDKLVTLWAPAISKSFSKFTDSEWNQLFEAQKKAEWWKEWTLSEPTTSNAITWPKNNSLKRDELYELSFETWIDINEIASLNNSEVLELKASIKEESTRQKNEMKKFENTADTLNWGNFQMTHKITREELIGLLYAISQWLSAEDRADLNASWISNDTIDSAIKMTAYSSTSWWDPFGKAVGE